jgi:exonuclease SbcC
MNPLKLSLAGFLSYQEPVELDFRSLDLACISGPNGAGKSSLLDALTWALFGIARQRDDSLINSKSDFAEVVFLFAYEGNTYRVQRTKAKEKPTRLEFHILQSGSLDGEEKAVWKPLTEHTLRETQGRIQATLRMDYETFVNASFFLQGKADLFTQQRPGDRKRILGSILGLEIWEQYRQQAAERRRLLEVSIKNLEGRQQEIDTELAEEQARKDHLKQIQTELDSLEKARKTSEDTLETIRQITASLTSQRDFVSSLDRQLKAVEAARLDLINRIQVRRDERDGQAQLLDRAVEIEAAYQAWEQAREQLSRWEEIAGRFREQETRRAEPLMQIQEARTRLEAEQAALLKTLKQNESNLEAFARLKGEVQVTEQTIELVQLEIRKRTRVENDLQQARVLESGLEVENKSMKVEMEALKERIDQLESTEGAVCPLCGQPLAPGERKDLIERLSSEGREKGDRYRANKSQLEEAGGKIQSLESNLAGFGNLEGELQGRIGEAGQQAARLETLEKEFAAWEGEGAPRLAEVGISLREGHYAPEARSKLAEIDAELKEIGYDAAAHDEVRKAEADGHSHEAAYRDLERARAALAPLEREIAGLEQQLGGQEDEISRLGSELQKAAEALAEAEARAPDLESAEAELFRIQEEENRLRMEVGAARQKVLVLDDLKERRASIVAERESIAGQVVAHRQLERAFGRDGVPALLIEQALPQIETKANEILDRLSGGTMSVRFQTQAAFKDRQREDLKETLDIQISDSAGIRDYELYSGGEAFRVNFAIRLALSEVLAQRSGARLQTLVIDEGFGSQDTAGRQRLIEAINLVRPDFARILVITHIDDMREAFPNRIEVEKTDRGSKVTLI